MSNKLPRQIWSKPKPNKHRDEGVSTNTYTETVKCKGAAI